MQKTTFRLVLVIAGVMLFLVVIKVSKTDATTRIVMSMSLSSRETGDVIWTGSTTGANGNVGTRANPTLAEIGLSRASDLRIIAEINEPTGSQVQLQELDLVIYPQNPTCVPATSHPRGGQEWPDVCTALLGPNSLIPVGGITLSPGTRTFKPDSNTVNALQNLIDTRGTSALHIALEATIDGSTGFDANLPSNGSEIFSADSANCPNITGLSPTSGTIGSNVVITGTNFTGVTSVKFQNNVNGSFVVNSNTQITATVPTNAVAGPISVSRTGDCDPTQSSTFTPIVQPTLQFSSGTFVGSEDFPGVTTITVTRSGSTTAEAFVNYSTTNVSASDKTDYSAAVGRLRFAPGEAIKTFNILITNDAFSDNGESFNVALSNPVGAVLGIPEAAGVAIVDNDLSNGPSPVKEPSFNREFYVRQHYADFLNRAPDTSGLNFWMDQTSNCGNPDLRVCRINTSAAFYLSIEFQETGYLVYRLYDSAFGNLSGKPVPITLRDFLAGTRQIGEGVQVGIGNWQQQLETNKTTFAQEFVVRSDFLALYPGTMTAAQFVDALFVHAAVTPTTAERQAAITAFGTGNVSGRASSLRAVAECETLKTAEFRKAFVLMQYFGYLRRNPDDAPDANFSGWQFWLDKLNQFNGDFLRAEMVKAFLESSEYVSRFGQ